MTDFCIIDQHTAATDGAAFGGPIDAGVLQEIAATLEVQANRDFAAYWGGAHRWRVATASAPPMPTEVVAALVDALPADDAGASAFHTWVGVPQIYVAKSQCNALTSGPDALSVLFSHEGCEEIMDPGCNRWVDNPADGFSYALEACDAVEASTYVLDGVAVSNFLLPSFFDPGGSAPWDFGATISYPAGLTSCFGTAPNGYQVRRPTGGGEAQVWGDVRAARLAKKRHPSSRTYRRGARA